MRGAQQTAFLPEANVRRIRQWRAVFLCIACSRDHGCKLRSAALEYAYRSVVAGEREHSLLDAWRDGTSHNLTRIRYKDEGKLLWIIINSSDETGALASITSRKIKRSSSSENLVRRPLRPECVTSTTSGPVVSASLACAFLQTTPGRVLCGVEGGGRVGSSGASGSSEGSNSPGGPGDTSTTAFTSARAIDVTISSSVDFWAH
eukprot:IDg3137t1